MCVCVGVSFLYRRFKPALLHSHAGPDGFSDAEPHRQISEGRSNRNSYFFFFLYHKAESSSVAFGSTPANVVLVAAIPGNNARGEGGSLETPRGTNNSHSHSHYDTLCDRVCGFVR